MLQLEVASEELVAWMGVERQIQLEVQRGLTLMLEALDIREESQLLLSGPEMVRDSRISSALKRGRREAQVSHSRVELLYAQLIARRGSALGRRTQDETGPVGPGGQGVVERAQSYFRERSRANRLLVRRTGRRKMDLRGTPGGVPGAIGGIVSDHCAVSSWGQLPDGTSSRTVDE